MAKSGIPVVVLEKNPYPNHKVCGEYVSKEVAPLLEFMGLSLSALGAKSIDTLVVSAADGKHLETVLPLGGFGISRYVLDEALFQLAKDAGVVFRFETALETTFERDLFRVRTSNEVYSTKVVIGAFGKRSNIDKALHRGFMQKKSPWLGIKCHYDYPDFPQDTVALHSFPGGYGGLSMTEDGAVNFCYLAHYNSFKAQSGVREFNTKVVAQNPFLNHFLENARPIFEKPLSIAQISFSKKKAVENHILMCGDSAGLIHPLCGNGMAMAIHAGKLAAESVIKFFAEKAYGREAMEKGYARLWKSHFQSRLFFGRQIQALLLQPAISQWAIRTMATQEKIVQAIVQRTHGKPILV